MPDCFNLTKNFVIIIIIIIIDNRGLNTRWCLTPLLLSLPLKFRYHDFVY